MHCHPDHKARLHERLPALAAAICARSERQDIALDACVISATPYEELRRKQDDGTWDREHFTLKHILFLERDDRTDYDYMDKIFQEQADKLGASP